MIDLQKWSTTSMFTFLFLAVACVVSFTFTQVTFAQNGEQVPAQSSNDAAQSALVQTNVSSSSVEEPSTTSNNVTVESISSPDDTVVGDFVVGPGKTDIVIEPGTSKVVELLVTNRTGITRQFNFEIEDATGSNNAETPIVLLGSERGPYTLKDYIQLPQASFELKHNERARVPVTIQVPIDAEPGGRYGSVLVTTVSKDAVKGDGGNTAPASAIISRVGSLFFLTIPGDTAVSAEFKSIALVPAKSFVQGGPITMQLLFENTGDLHLNPYGEIRITNISGAEVGFMELDPWFAMPQSMRSREVTWDRELLIGRYTATAYINRGYDDIIDTHSVTFWVLPWKVIAVVFGGVFLLLLTVRFILKNFEFKRKQS